MTKRFAWMNEIRDELDDIEAQIITEEEAVARVLQAGRKDPVTFVREVMGAQLWSVQADIVRSVFYHPRVAVKSCHSSGKTYVAARIALAFFYLYPGCKIITTAPTWQGVQRQLWGEVHAAFASLPEWLRHGVTLHQTELSYGNDWWMIGLSTDQGVRFQGHHAARMLVVLDEANGIAPDIWAAAETLGAGGRVHYLAIANPTEASGPFYDAFTSQRARWKTITIDAFDTPNLHGLTPEALRGLTDEALDCNPWPTLITRRFVRDALVAYGETSSFWLSRIRGEFPVEGQDSLIALAWCERARVPAEDTGGPVIAGVDVAGPGKAETVVVIRQGGTILEVVPSRKPDARGDVIAALRPYAPRLQAVHVDCIGAGMYLAPALRDAGFPAIDINVSLPPPTEGREKFLNLRASGYWSLREKLKDGAITGLLDEALIAQLISLRYHADNRGRIVIESKEELARRGVPSPDRADAMMLAFLEPTTIERTWIVKPRRVAYVRQTRAR